MVIVNEAVASLCTCLHMHIGYGIKKIILCLAWVRVSLRFSSDLGVEVQKPIHNNALFKNTIEFACVLFTNSVSLCTCLSASLFCMVFYYKENFSFFLK